MKKSPSFNVGDKVFAKVKGYPAWPAMIIEDHTTKFNVRFYGTGETGIVKSKDVFYYLKHKKTFIKPLKRKDYNEAIEEIEQAIKECGGTDGNAEEVPNAPNLSENVDSTDAKGKRKRSESLDKTNGSPTKKVVLDNISNNDSVPETSQTEKPTKKVVPERSPRKLKTRGSTTKEVTEEISETQGVKETDEQENSKLDEQEISKLGEDDKSKSEQDHKSKSDEDDKPKLDENDESKLDEDNKSKLDEDNKNEADEKVEDEVQAIAIEPDTKEPDLTAKDIKIVTEDYLTAIISYAEFVKKDEDKYKKKPVEVREKFENEVVLIKTPSGKYIGIKYNRNEPPSLDNEHDQAVYDATEANTVLSLKKLVEEDKCNPESDKNLFITNIGTEEKEVQEIVKLEIIQRKKDNINKLKTESKLIELDTKIRKSLGLDKADPEEAIQYLDEMFKLDIQPLMLKKHPHVVDMVQRLGKYTGNVHEWDFTKEQVDEFEVLAERVRTKADEIYNKFVHLFKASDGSTLSKVFHEEVDNFKDQVKHLTQSAIFSLTSEPNSRQSFLDKIYNVEQLKITVDNQEERSETESDNVNETKLTASSLSNPS